MSDTLHGLSCALAIAVFLASPASAQTPSPSGTVFTIAGNGSTGFDGDGGPALNASLGGPAGLAVAPDGTIYFADNNNFRIRRIDPVTGIITTIAGDGTCSGDGQPDGDNGPATQAQMCGVLAVAVDGARHALYLGDIDDNRVRRVDLITGIMTAYAGCGIFCFGDQGDGGPAVVAQFAFLEGVCTDGAGRLCVADIFNERIRRVDPLTGVISTVAGGGGGGDYCGDGGPAFGACVGGVGRVTADRAGNIFLTSNDNGQSPSVRRVRRVDAATGIITTVAGGGATIPGSGPATSMQLVINDISVDADGKTLWIAGPAPGNQYTSGRVYKVDLATGFLTTIAGIGNGNSGSSYSGDGGPATAAEFHDILGVTNTPAGEILISDNGNRRIRYIVPDSIRLACSGQTALRIPWISALTGELIVADNPDLTMVDAGTVGTIAGDVDVNGNTNAGSIDLGSLGSASDVNVSGNTNAGSIDLGSLGSAADVNVSGNTNAGSIDLGSLGSASDVDVSGNTNAGSIDLGLLGSASDVNVSGNTNAGSIDLGSLGSASDVDISGNTSVNSIDLASLTSSGGDVDISGNSSANSIDLASLTSSGGDVDISGNTSANTIDLGSLTSAGGDVDISGNTSVNSIDLASLTSSGGDVDISGNTSSNSIDLASLTTSGGDVDISGNTSANTIDLSSLTSVGQTAASLAESAHLFASSPLANDHLGAAVAVSGNTMIATAPDADLPGKTDAGAAYLYTAGDGVWSAPVRITAGSFAGANYHFGQSAAIDGDTMLIGASDQLGAPGQTWGSVYVFTRSVAVWSTTPAQQLLSPSPNPPINDCFGNAVAISGDIAAIGEYLDSGSLDDNHAYGAVHIFSNTAGVWSAVQTILPPKPKHLGRFGASLALQGTTLLVGSPGADRSTCRTDAGAVWVYDLSADGTTSTQQAVLVARDAALNDQFGQVALDGDYAVIGAYSADALSVSDAGAAYVFHRAAGVWSQVSRLHAPTSLANAHFGASVALYGDIAMIGAPQNIKGTGAAHTFKRIANGNWIHQSSVTASDAGGGDQFGSAVAFDGVTAAVGALSDNTAGGVDAGSVYVGAITTGGGGLSITNNPNATTINTGAVFIVDGDTNVTGNTSVTSVDLGSLQSIGGDTDVTGNTSAVSVDLGSLTSVGGDTDVTGNSSAVSVDLGSLETVGGDTDVTDNTSAVSVDLGSLTSVGGDTNVTGNTSAVSVDLGSLETVGGDTDVTGNTSAVSVDLGSLTSTGDNERFLLGGSFLGDITVSGNIAATTLDLHSLTSVGGDLTITDNPALSNVAFPALEMVEGSLTLETRVQSSVDLAGVVIAGDLTFDSTHATSVLGMTPAGNTHISIQNAETRTWIQLPSESFAGGTSFDIERIPPESLSTGPGFTALGDSATVDPLSAAHFDFGETPPANDVSLDFELTLSELSPADQAAIIAAWQSDHLSMTHQSNLPGSHPQAIPVCGGGLLGCTPPVVTISALNDMHLPIGEGQTPAYFHFDAQVTGFSTYAVAIVTPLPRIPGDANCDGHIDGGDINAFLQALTDPNAYVTAHPTCNIRNADSNADGPINLADVAPFVNCILNGVCP